MTLQNISYAMRAVADVTRAGGHLLSSIDRSRRGGTTPVILAVALGAGIGVMIFRKDLRDRLFQWATITIASTRSSANNVNAELRSATDPARV